MNNATFASPRQVGPSKVRTSVTEDVTDGSSAAPSRPRWRGFVIVPHAATAIPGMSDKAFRVWTTLPRWSYRGGFPSNSQIALACGWVAKDGRPAVWEAIRAIRELEKLGLVRRITVAVGKGQRRAGLEVVTPEQWEARQVAATTGAPAKVATEGIAPVLEQGERRCPTVQSAGATPGTAPVPHRLKNRCRQDWEDGPRTRTGTKSRSPERRRPGTATVGPALRPQEARQPGATAPTPLAAPDVPTVPREGSATIVDAPAVKAFLDGLDGPQRAKLASVSGPKRDQILDAVRRGMPAIALVELNRTRPPVPAMAIPETLPELIAALATPGAPPHWVAAATEGIVNGLGSAKDRRLWPAIERAVGDVYVGRLPAEALTDAYRQSQNPKARIPGAVFKTALSKQYGWSPNAISPGQGGPAGR